MGSRSEAQNWLRNGKLHFSASHLVRVTAILKELDREFGKMPLAALTPDVLSKYQQSERAKGLKSATVNRKTEVVMAVLNFAVKQRRIAYNPCVGFQKFRSERLEMRFWTEQEVASFLEYTDRMHFFGGESRWVHIVYLLAICSGLRAGEIWGLKAQDISPDGKVIRVQRQYNRVTKEMCLTKSRKSRTVPCPQFLHFELVSWIQREKILGDQTLFSNRQGKPICHDNFADRNFAKDLEAWGGKRIRFHDLRHTATTLLISKGVDIKTVKEICGHSDISTTMNYIHLVGGSIERVSEMYSSVEGLLSVKKKEVS